MTLRQHCGNVVPIVTKLQSRNFTKCLTPFQRYAKVVSANILVFLYANNIHLIVKSLLNVEPSHLIHGSYATDSDMSE